MSYPKTVRIVAAKTKGNDLGYSILNESDFNPKVHKLFGGDTIEEGGEVGEVAEGSAEWFADSKNFPNKAALHKYLDDHKVPYESDANRAALEALCVAAFAAAAAAAK